MQKSQLKVGQKYKTVGGPFVEIVSYEPGAECIKGRLNGRLDYWMLDGRWWGAVYPDHPKNIAR
jgi:hypothetical protein